MNRQRTDGVREQDFSALLSPLDSDEMAARVSAMAEPLLRWYKACGRKLPWREMAEKGDENAPYYVWLSEIMLQQTRVEAVIPYYHRFLEAVPDIPSLATADDQLLHKLWEGLGYYSRVRNLKKGAVQVMERYGGRLPASIPLLREICGIGDYTAGAIGSIAFGLREPAVDGNLLRVTSRLLAAEGDIGKPAVKRAFHDLLLRLCLEMSAAPGDFNQAMMDLGSGVCTPGTPDCDSCPVSRYCLAHERGQADLFPVKSKAKERRVEEKTVLVILTGERRDRVLLHQRPDKGLLAGLWEFPMLDGFRTDTQVRQELGQMGLMPQRVMALQNAKHIFTHIEWQMKGFLALCPQGNLPEGLCPATLAQLEQEYPLPSAFRVYRAAAVSQLEKTEEELLFPHDVSGNGTSKEIQEELL